jgi:hypothetical protein
MSNRIQRTIVNVVALLVLSSCAETKPQRLSERSARSSFQEDVRYQRAREALETRSGDLQALPSLEQDYQAAARTATDRASVLRARDRFARAKAELLDSVPRSLPAGVEPAPAKPPATRATSPRSPQKVAAYQRAFARHNPNDPQDVQALRQLKQKLFGGK